MIRIFVLFIILFFLSTTASAKDSFRQEDAHEHGSGKLNIVLEKKELHIELIAPAVDFVGFEHEPHNDSQRKKVKEVTTLLENSKQIFSINGKSGCKLKTASAKFSSLHSDDDDNDHDDHADDHAADDHAADDHADDDHAEIFASYEFLCENPEKLENIDVQLFKQFPSLERLQLQYVTPAGQGTYDLTKKHHNISGLN